MYKLWIALVASLLAGCSGSSDSVATSVLSTQITGVAMDGYLSNADVFYDLNDNGAIDPGEPSATTGANGNYALTIRPEDVGKHRVVLKAVAGMTIDSDNPGVPINAGFVLSATADHPEIISPLTTQIAAAMIATPALTSAQAEVQVKLMLGLSGSSTSLFQDFANRANQVSNSDLVMLANHAKVIRTQMQTEAAANPSESPLDVIKTVAANLQAQIKSGALDVTKINVVTPLDNTSVNNIISSAVGAPNSTQTAVDTAAKATADAAAAQAAADAKSAAKTLGTATSIFGSPNSVYQ